MSTALESTAPTAARAVAAAPPYIRVDGVTKTYRSPRGNVQALADVSLDVGEREFVSIVGPSGCGKSTLLMLVAGLYLVSRGRITVGGREVAAPVTDLGIVFRRTCCSTGAR